MANALVSVQIIPSVPDGADKYAYVDEAIKVIEEAGVKYEVHPLETTMEGEMTDLMSVIQTMNDKLISMGASNIISQIKLFYQPAGITGETLTEKYK